MRMEFVPCGKAENAGEQLRPFFRSDSTEMLMNVEQQDNGKLVGQHITSFGRLQCSRKRGEEDIRYHDAEWWTKLRQREGKIGKKLRRLSLEEAMSKRGKCFPQDRSNVGISSLVER